MSQENRPWIKFGKHREVTPLWLHVPAKYMSQLYRVRNGVEKEFCIIEFYGDHALCAWRSNKTCRTGIPFTCKIETRGGKSGIVYKGKFYPFGRYGWVF